MALRNSQFNEIMRSYGDRQLRNARLQKARREEVYQRLPGLRDLDNELITASVHAAEAALAGDSSLSASLPSKIRSIRDEKDRLLESAGYPADYLELPYDCPYCRDSGFVDGAKCRCFRQQEQSFLYRQSNVEGIVRRENFDHFNLSVYDGREPLPEAGGRTCREYMRSVEAGLRRWCADFPQKGGNIIFMGNPGTGKTFLMNCITKALLDSYHSVIYLGSADLFESFSRSMRGQDEDAEAVSDAILETELLLIDDLGTEFSNSFTTSKLFYVLNQRLVMKKSVIISTNLSFRGLRDLYSDRIVSRIMSDYEIIPLYGRDQRLHMV